MSGELSATERAALGGLVSREPDAIADREALELLCDEWGSAAHWLVEEVRTRRDWKEMPLGRLLPGLESLSGSPVAISRDARSQHCLGSAGLTSWPQLAAESPAWLSALPNLGKITFHHILDAVVARWAEARLRSAGTVHGVDGSSTLDTNRTADGPTTSPGLHDEVAEVSAWATETRGATGLVEAVLAAANSPEALPDRVAEALAALGEFRPPTTTRERYNLARAFEELESADPDSFEIFRVRQLSAGKRPTLQELGTELGVTRERVRQREDRVKASIRRRMEEDSGWPIRVAAERLRERFGPLARVDELTTVQQFLDPSGEALDGHAHRMTLLLTLAGKYGVQDSWILGTEIETASASLLSEVTEDGPAPLDAVVERLGAMGIREELRMPWIERHESFRVIGDQIVRWGRSMADKAAAVLSVVGEPLDPEDLFERIGEDKNFRGFKMQIQGDSRFMRRGLKLYGLSEWGGEEYTTVVDEMTEELARRGGWMDLDELATTLAETFGVSENSVRMYAKGPQFEIDHDGRVSRRSGELPVPRSAPLEVTRCCFRVDGGWAYRRRVDHDVLRGSGGSLPISFAKHLGLRPGQSLRFESRLGDISCTWPSHMAHIGSLRTAAEALGAADGDLLFVLLVGAGKLDIRLVRRAVCDAAAGYERLALECGQRAAASPEAAVAEALELDPGQPNLGTAIRLRLQERGEQDLASLVPPEVAGDDVLDVLASLGE